MTGTRIPASVASLHGGTQKRYRFDNGYGASVVRHKFSYSGTSNELWELAVTDHRGDLIYDTPITNDVIGWLSDEAVEGLLDQIAALPPKKEAESDTPTVHADQPR